MTIKQPSGRMAVLISGQVRSDNSDIKLIADACQDLNVDLFICVWRKRGTKGFGGGQGLLQLTRIFGDKFTITMPRNWIGANMRSVFPKSDHILPDLGNLTEEGLAEIFPDAQIRIEEDNDELTIPYMDSNSLRMLYMINQCNQMKQQAEKAGGFVYDVVARHRPDVRLDYARAASHFKSRNKVLLPKSDTTIGHLHDIYWVCSSADDNLLTSLYHRAESTRKKGWHGIHNELYQWTISKSIDYEMYPCATSGLNDPKQGNTSPQHLTASNLARAVKNKEFDFEFAGGPFFCETYDLVFDAALNGHFPNQETLEQMLDEVTQQKIKPRQKLFLLQAICWLICFNPARPSDERFAGMLVALAIDYLTKNQRAAKWATAVAPNIFIFEEKASVLTQFLLDGHQPYFSKPSFPTKIFDLVKSTHPHSEEDAIAAMHSASSDTLRGGQNWKWFVARLHQEGDFEGIMRICELQLQNGIYQRGLVNQGVRASHLIGDNAKTLALLQLVANVAKTGEGYAEVGRFLVKTGDIPAAKQAFELANAQPDTPKWVAKAIKNLEVI